MLVLEGNSFTLRSAREKAAVGERTDIIMGIRPENMTSPDGEIKLVVKVDMTEMLGSEKIVYFYIGKVKCSVKLPPNFAVDEDLVLKINKKNIFLFDKHTSERVY